MLRLTQWLFTSADPHLCRPGANIEDPEELIETWNIVYREFKEYYDEVIRDRRACPRTAVEDVPEDWVCPMCGTPRSDFSLMKE